MKPDVIMARTKCQNGNESWLQVNPIERYLHQNDIKILNWMENKGIVTQVPEKFQSQFDDVLHSHTEIDSFGAP